MHEPWFRRCCKRSSSSSAAICGGVAFASASVAVAASAVAFSSLVHLQSAPTATTNLSCVCDLRQQQRERKVLVCGSCGFLWFCFASGQAGSDSKKRSANANAVPNSMICTPGKIGCKHSRNFETPLQTAGMSQSSARIEERCVCFVVAFVVVAAVAFLLH